METEKQMQQRILTAAKAAGWRVYLCRDSRYTNDAGFPDLVLASPTRDRVVFAELKSQTGRLSAAQEKWYAMLVRANTVAMEVVRPDTADDFIQRLESPE